jgi:RimJ/RimL family protein N-acetyltransferase
MRDTLRLTFTNNKTTVDLDELWLNCFAGQSNLNHMNAYVPFPVTLQFQLNGFLNHDHGYKSWLIKRKNEQDIIGFAIHGNFIPGIPNNIGFNIGLKYTRHGFASETLHALIEYVKEIGLHETFGHCFENNIASIRTMEKCGFQNLGRTGRNFQDNNELKFIIEL